MTREINNRLAGFIHAASHNLEQGNLALAELICRQVLDEFGSNADASCLLGIIAYRLQLPIFSVQHLQAALQLNTKHRVAAEYLARAQAAADNPGAPDPDKPGFILIKAWGFGFWSDIDHVLGQLLLAEITGRTPVVHWGENSLFRDGDTDNAFECFFKPVSRYSLDDLVLPEYSFFPPKWNRQNLGQGEVDKWDGRYSRIAGLYLLGRNEDVVVSDFHTLVRDLLPWIHEGHVLHGESIQGLYRYLFDKYLRLRPDIRDEIESFAVENMGGRHMLAVHVRGSDKIIEVKPEALEAINRSYEEAIRQYISVHSGTGIFLLTDSKAVVEEYSGRYGDRLVLTDSARSGDDTGVHFIDHPSREQIGREVIKDVYLASRCNNFIGNGRSNVSTSVLHLRNWNDDEYTLFGNSILEEVNYFLHRR